jgi:Fe-S-cluster-containing hydrogenase component 2/CRP-like cAMP-binding protein
MAKQIVVNPPAELRGRDTDVPLTPEQLLKLSLFAPLKQKPALDKFPGYVRLRRYAADEVICRQGEAGFTAFYLLTSEDVLALRQGQLRAAPDDPAAEEWRRETAALGDQLARGGGPESRPAATAYLATARPAEPRAAGLLARLRLRLGGAAKGAPDRKPLYVPMDGPTDIPYETRRAVLHEGEVFGEMSCLYRAPRSATVVTGRAWYALEMLRNILDALYKDAGYRARADEIYRQRVLENHLRNLPLFADLPEAQLKQVRDTADLVSFEPGEIIWDEHDRSDHMCIIRSGIVRVMTGVSPLLRPDDIADWPAFRAALLGGERQEGAPAGRVCQGLGEGARAAARGDGADPGPVVLSLNAMIRDRGLPEAKEFRELLASAPFQARVREWPANRKSWSDAQARRYNRLLLEAVFPDHLRGRPAAGPARTLAYCSRGELLGEAGTVLGLPRSATCLASGHADDNGGRVELVSISAELFRSLADGFPPLRERVKAIADERRKRDRERDRRPPWDDGHSPLLSDQAASLGLIQGQRLMLIDLDRCTRCDECVRACVNTHDDGQSRLFLDGPRFGNYLVPTTCRSCLDPVCMIGCPVGAIHRGGNGEMRIEDWCIGCDLCAKNCPYGSIHMRDVGVIPEEAREWRYLAAAAVTDAKWHERGPSGSWAVGSTPFHFDQDFLESLRPHLPAGRASGGVAVCFLREFTLPADRLRGDRRFTLEVTSADEAPAVWVNGRDLGAHKKPKRGHEFEFAGRDMLRAGKNVVAARVTGAPGAAKVLFGLRLDEVLAPAGPLSPGVEAVQKPVTQRAVVCDLCSGLYGQVPACVNACPHDAALRVDARRFDFLRR